MDVKASEGSHPPGNIDSISFFLNRAWMVGITACCFSEQIAVSVSPTVSPNSAGVPPPRARDQRRPMSAVPAMTLATHWPTYRRVWRHCGPDCDVVTRLCDVTATAGQPNRGNGAFKGPDDRCLQLVASVCVSLLDVSFRLTGKYAYVFHFFTPGLKLSFSANPSHHNLPFPLLDWLHGLPGLFTDTSEHIRFYSLVFLFLHC